MSALRLNVPFVILMVSLFLSPVTGVAATAQNPEGSPCHVVSTDYVRTIGGFYWLNNDLVAFTVTNGELPNSIFEVRNTAYHYQPSTDQLQVVEESLSTLELPVKLRDNLPLTDLRGGPVGLYQFVEVAPDRQRLVFPRMVEGQTTYWLLDDTGSRTNLLDLGLPFVGDHAPLQLQVFWAADAPVLITQWGFSGAGDPEYPAYVIRLDDQSLTRHPLSEEPAFPYDGDILLGTNPRVLGLSPTGRYLVMQPQMTGNRAWLVDLEQDNLITLDLKTLALTKVVWTDETTFIMLSTMGVIEYDTNTGTFQVIASLEAIGSPAQPSFSPDGRYLLGTVGSEEGSSDPAGISVCELP